MSLADGDRDTLVVPPAETIEAQSAVQPTDIERVIQEFGAEYIEHIRSLGKAFESFYHEQLAGRDERLRDLSQQLAASNDEIEQLRRQIDDVHRESESMRVERRRVEQRVGQLAARLRELSDELEQELGNPQRQLPATGDEDQSDDGSAA